MKRISYSLLRLNGRIVGWSRTITEYMPLDGKEWTLDRISHNEGDTIRLAEPPAGISILKRPNLRYEK